MAKSIVPEATTRLARADPSFSAITSLWPGALGPGDTIFYSIALRHVISNAGSKDAVLYLVVTPQRNGR
jgi:hypothetical protein